MSLNTDYYFKKLRAELSEIDDGDAAGSDDQQTVVLDQQSVGRLSRMDAMQRQAMARATAQRRVARRLRIIAAIKRIEEEEFGYCTDCGEEIASARLELDPSAPLCLGCAKTS